MIKASGSYVTTGDISLSDCVSTGSGVALTLAATAKVEGGQVSLGVFGKHDAPD